MDWAASAGAGRTAHPPNYLFRKAQSKMSVTAFVVPASEGAKPENRFSFKLTAKGKTFTVPFVQFLSGESSDLFDAVAEGKVSGREASIARKLVAIECPEAVESFQKLADDQVVAISQAWAAASTASVGESSASDDS